MGAVSIVHGTVLDGQHSGTCHCAASGAGGTMDGATDGAGRADGGDHDHLNQTAGAIIIIYPCATLLYRAMSASVRGEGTHTWRLLSSDRGGSRSGVAGTLERDGAAERSRGPLHWASNGPFSLIGPWALLLGLYLHMLNEQRDFFAGYF